MEISLNMIANTMNRFNFFKTLIGSALFSTLPRINPIVTKLPIKRKLKSNWTFELEQDLMSFHSIETSKEMSKEIDNEFIRSIEHHI